MALHHKCIKYIEEVFELVEEGLEGNKACQLGAAGLRRSAKEYLRRRYSARFRKLNGYLAHHGFETITIDIDGKRGNLPIDLSLPIEDDNLIGAFDLVISFGTIEHVEDQYELFRNIHNLCKVGGAVILNCPVIGSYSGHGTWTYDFVFFKKLFDACGYRILDIRITNLKYGHIRDDLFCMYVSYSKVEGSKFIEREKFGLPHYDSVGYEKDKGLYDGCRRA